MKCPKCNVELQPNKDRGVEAHACPKCAGIWFTATELDEFEDLAIDPDIKTGSLYLVTRPTTLKCPVCSAAMSSFDYRFNDLKIDCCPDHGYWLDAGEDQRVLALLRQEAKSKDRKFKAEQKWANHLRWIQSPTFFSKIKTLIDDAKR